MSPEEAIRALGEPAVRAAYAAALKAAHPDHGGDAETAASRIKHIVKARDTLLALFTKETEEKFPACIQCGGRGTVPGAFGARTCSACDGTGEQR